MATVLSGSKVLIGDWLQRGSKRVLLIITTDFVVHVLLHTCADQSGHWLPVATTTQTAITPLNMQYYNTQLTKIQTLIYIYSPLTHWNMQQWSQHSALNHFKHKTYLGTDYRLQLASHTRLSQHQFILLLTSPLLIQAFKFRY